MSSRTQILENLRNRLRELETNCHAGGEVVSTGNRDLDQLLAKGGLQRGTLTEWLGNPGSGAATLALIAARSACGEQGILAIIDERGDFYPPAAAALGVDLRRTIVVQPANSRDRDWSLIQTLRSPGLAAVVCWPDRIPQRMLRRMQLAGERGGALGLVVRPTAALAEPSWAKVRLAVKAQPSLGHERRWQVAIVDSQTPGREAIQLEMDHETAALRTSPSQPVPGAVPVAAPFAAAAPLHGAAPA